jgi:phosphoribosylanthranilate isomerase
MAPAPAPRRTVVKVCGITRLEDAGVAVEAGADWLGFVLWDRSPRRIAAEQARAILSELPQALGVAVLVDPEPGQALLLAESAGARRVQVHRPKPGWPVAFPLPVTIVVSVNGDGRLGAPLPHAEHLLMLDASDPVRVGGTGESFPWDTAATLAARRPVLLAGGLDAENVAAAIERVRPFGVDASSRLESEPGIKDPQKVLQFVAAVRRCDERLHAARA